MVWGHIGFSVLGFKGLGLVWGAWCGLCAYRLNKVAVFVELMYKGFLKIREAIL